MHRLPVQEVAAGVAPTPARLQQSAFDEDLFDCLGGPKLSGQGFPVQLKLYAPEFQ
jgi:hypothetical protein